MPPWIGLHHGCGGRSILPLGKAERHQRFRRCVRLVRVKFDTHRTRQIAAENGGKPGLSRRGSFPIRFDLPRGKQVAGTSHLHK